jgi:serine/threonine protein kinase
VKVSIRLPRGEWHFDDTRRLGRPGGFGEVFEGQDSSGNLVAIKRLRLEAAQAAYRELTLADELAGHDFEHVLAPIDSGQDANSGSYLIVMPRAEKTLDDEVRLRGKIPHGDCVEILRQIADGLQEIPQIVHRDLKPANILFHAGRWKIADFGIARFVEDATSVNTLKECLTPAFAAPEQWSGEHASAATDVYALCCIAHVLFSGQPPFLGPAMADFRQQHLSAPPPPLATSEPRLRALVAAGLRKPQGGRPSISRMSTVLEDVAAESQTPPLAIAELQAANALEAERITKANAEAERQRRASEARQALISAGASAFRDIVTELERVVAEQASEVKIHRSADLLSMRIGDFAELNLRFEGGIPPNALFSYSKWQPIAIAKIHVQQRAGVDWTHGATLWYMRLTDKGEYRWYEVSYRRHALSGGPTIGPFPIQDVGNDVYRHADAAAGPGMHAVEIEFGPEPIDDECIHKFVQRWLSRLAQAYNGRLRPF